MKTKATFARAVAIAASTAALALAVANATPAALDDLPGTTLVYTAAETDAAIAEAIGSVAAPGDYETVSNRAMTALQPEATNSISSIRDAAGNRIDADRRVTIPNTNGVWQIEGKTLIWDNSRGKWWWDEGERGGSSATSIEKTGSGWKAIWYQWVGVWSEQASLTAEGGADATTLGFELPSEAVLTATRTFPATTDALALASDLVAATNGMSGFLSITGGVIRAKGNVQTSLVIGDGDRGQYGNKGAILELQGGYTHASLEAQPGTSGAETQLRLGGEINGNGRIVLGRNGSDVTLYGRDSGDIATVQNVVDATNGITFVGTAGYANSAGSADSALVAKSVGDNAYGALPAQYVADKRDVAASNAVIMATVDTKQDALPYPTNAIPYSAISGMVSVLAGYATHQQATNAAQAVVAAQPKPLAGQTINLTGAQSLYFVISNIVEALGGTVTLPQFQ